MTSLMWFRRDLRMTDNPSLTAAAARGDVVACFVLDPEQVTADGPTSIGWLASNLRALHSALNGRLTLRVGAPAKVIPALAEEVGASAVYAAAECEPMGVARDAAVRDELVRRGIAWREIGSPYAVTPGKVTTRDGGGFKVFSAFAKSWQAHSWPEPAPAPASLELIAAPSDPASWSKIDKAVAACPIALPPAGEAAARQLWQKFVRKRLDDYAVMRDRPDSSGTSWLSPYLRLGVIHPRTLLSDLGARNGAGVDRFIAELAWREFYADVAWRNPSSLTSDLNPLPIIYDEPGEQFAAWCEGRTGFPLVDAGQRQLLATGWMHNRVRMISASFLTKDLHLWWGHGAEFFARHLLDSDRASNVHGWQWVAGTGTDAAPYFRIFNPIIQAEHFDPDGDYVRKWVPELSHLRGTTVHRPWDGVGGYDYGYPQRIIDHDVERLEAMARYQTSKAN
jgi:deoxyribodipyrimidine photo-lyase